MSLDPRAAELMHAYLAAIDAASPGLVEGAHVVGSAVLDDFRPGVSDLNFVAVTATALSKEAATTVEEVHRRLASARASVPLDGIYVNRDELGDLSKRAVQGPHVRAGKFVREGTHGRTPTDLHVLATCSETLRGLPVRDLSLRSSIQDLDADAVASTREAVRAAATKLHTPEAVSSLVLGVTRRHYVLVTGRLTSKSQAGLYGLVSFPGRFRGIIEEALRIRREPHRSSSYNDAASRDREALEYVRAVAADVHDLSVVANGL